MHHLTQPWGDLQSLPNCTRPQSKVCLHKSTLQSANILLCQACSAVCKEGKRTELERAIQQSTALRSVTASLQETRHSRLVRLSHPRGFCPLSVPFASPLWSLLYLTEQTIKCKNAFVCILSLFFGWRGEGRSGDKSTQYWNYSKQKKIFNVTHLGKNTPWKANRRPC